MSAGRITAGKWTAVAPIVVNGVEHIGVGVLGTQKAIALCGFCRAGDEPESIANAYLIASAPDLLAERDSLKAANAELADTLDEFLAAFDGVIAQGGISLSVDDKSSGWISRARAALEKHKGETA